MSTVIDNKVVEMSFDNRNFEAGAKQSLNTLDKLKQALNFSNATKGFESLNAGFSPLQNGLAFAQNGFSALEAIAFGALTRIGAKITDVGMNMVRSLTVAPIKEGFNEYELKMGSVQTIMAGTGAPLEQVMDKLNELNKYADRTIYSFADMTNNIGKFTNAGVDLDTAVAAIQGVANVAALSGANSNEASRAMYNFSQALSSGYVKLIDWKSIENANMATVEFKTQLLESAVAAKTLTKTADGMYKTVNGGLKISATSNFNDSLQKQWMTTEVLTETLKKYTDETTEIGKKAFAAAQDVKTFTQLMDTLKEAVGSGWAETWEIIFGNFEEAKKLWTAVSNAVGGFIDKQSDLRNSVLGSWKEFGGRDNLLAAFSNIGNLFKDIVAPIKKAFAVVNPFWNLVSGPNTDKMAAKLRVLTSNFKYFTERLKLTTKESDGIFHLFKGIFSILGTAGKIVGAVVKGFKGIFKEFTGLGDGIGKTATKIGDFLFNLSLSAQKMNLFQKITKVTAEIVHRLCGVINVVLELLGKLFGTIGSTVKAVKGLGTVTEKVNAIVSGIVNTIKNLIIAIVKAVGSLLGIDVSGFVEKIENFFANLSKYATAFVNMVSKIPSKLSSIFTKITGLKPEEVFNNIRDSAKGAIENIKKFFSGFKDIDTGPVDDFTKKTEEKFAPLTALFNGIKKVCSAIWDFFKKLAPVFAYIGTLIGNALGKLGDSMSEHLGDAEINLDTLFALFNSGVLTLILIKVKDLVESFGKIGDIGDNFSKVLDKIGGCFEAWQSKLQSQMILKIAAAVAIMAVSLVLLSTIDGVKLTFVVTTLTAVMAELYGMLRITNNIQATGMSTAATTLIKLSAAILIVALACTSLGKLDLDELGKGLLGVTAIIAVLTAVAIVLSKTNTQLLKGGSAMIMLAIALNLLVRPIENLAKLEYDKLNQGVEAVAKLIAIIGVFMLLVDGSNFGVGSGLAIVLLAAGLRLMIEPIKELGAMDFDKLKQGLQAFAIALAEIAIFSRLLGGGGKLLLASVGMVILAAAMNLLVKPIKDLGDMDKENLKQGLLGMAAALLAMAIALKLIPITALLKAAGLAVAAAGILILAQAMKQIGEMKPDQLKQALIAIGVSLLLLAVGLNAMLIALPGAAALLVASVALGILVPILKALGAMNHSELKTALLALAGVFLVLGAAGLVLAPVVPFIIALAGAILLLGVAVAAIGAGVALLGAGLATLAVTGTVGITTLEAMILMIIGMIPSFAKAVGKGIIEIVKVIGESIPVILEVVVKILDAILEALITLIPKIVQFLLTLFVALRVLIPDLIDTLLDILVGVLEGIRDHIGEIVTLLVEIVGNLIGGLIEAFPLFVERIGLAIINAIYTLGDVMVEQAPLLRDAIIHLAKSMMIALLEFFGMSGEKATTMVNTGTSLIKSFIQGIADKISAVVAKIKSMCKQMKEKITEKFQEWKNAGRDLIDKVKTGITEKVEAVKNAISDLVQKIKDKFTGFIQDFIDIGKNLIQGFIDGITGKSKDVEETAGAVGNAAKAGAMASLEENSPSKAFRKIGRNADAGMILGLRDYASRVETESSKVGSGALNAMQTTLERLSDNVNDNMDFNPTITPVLDLSEIQNGSGLINGMLGNQRMSLAFASSGFNYNAAYASGAQETMMSNAVNAALAKFVPQIVSAINSSTIDGNFTFDLTPNSKRYYDDMRVENAIFRRTNGYNGLG